MVLAKGLRGLGHDVGVLVFYPGGDLYHELLAAGIPVESLEKQHRWELIGFLQRIRLYLRRERPDILYSLLQVSNVVAAVEKLFVPTMKVIWGIRSASMELRYYDRLVRFSYWLEPRLSLLHQTNPHGQHDKTKNPDCQKHNSSHIGSSLIE